MSYEIDPLDDEPIHDMEDADDLTRGGQGRSVEDLTRDATQGGMLMALVLALALVLVFVKGCA